MKYTLDHAVELTQYLLVEYYQKNRFQLLSLLSDDAVWFSPGNVSLFGAAAIRKWFLDNDTAIPSAILEEKEFYSLEFSDKCRVVMGQYTLHQTGKVSVNKVRQRVTCCYWLGKRDLQLFHVHFSNEWNESIPNKSYQHIQNVIKNNYAEEHEEKIIIKSDVSIQLLNPEMVMYVEAFGSSCVIHYMDRNITVRKILGDLLPLLPEYFYRPHRSYLVNSNYILKVERYFMTMVTGEKVPIPEKRYTQVREDILALVQKHNI